MSDEQIRQLALKLDITPENLRKQVIRSAFANARMENPNITTETLKKVTAASSRSSRRA